MGGVMVGKVLPPAPLFRAMRMLLALRQEFPAISTPELFCASPTTESNCVSTGVEIGVSRSVNQIKRSSLY